MFEKAMGMPCPYDLRSLAKNVCTHTSMDFFTCFVVKTKPYIIMYVYTQ